MNKFRKILLKITTIGAIGCILIAVALAIIPFLIGYLFMLAANDLTGEWRRSRQQTWLSKWARKVKVKAEGVW